jgi:hypothetical protein
MQAIAAGSLLRQPMEWWIVKSLQETNGKTKWISITKCSWTHCQ